MSDDARIRAVTRVLDLDGPTPVWDVLQIALDSLLLQTVIICAYYIIYENAFSALPLLPLPTVAPSVDGMKATIIFSFDAWER